MTRCDACCTEHGVPLVPEATDPEMWGDPHLAANVIVDPAAISPEYLRNDGREREAMFPCPIAHPVPRKVAIDVFGLLGVVRPAQDEKTKSEAAIPPLMLPFPWKEGHPRRLIPLARCAGRTPRGRRARRG